MTAPKNVVKELKDLAIYHDHLVENVINQKLNKLNYQQKLFSQNKRNSDSRSTQQAFESAALS